jgi:hypothetical protein
MSSADTYATTSSAMIVDYTYRRLLRPGRPLAHYLTAARWWTVVSIAVAAASTLWIDDIKDYVKLSMALLSFLGVPIYFGVVWRRANQTGMWLSLVLGITSFLLIRFGLVGEDRLFATRDAAFSTSVFIPTALSLAGMWLGSLLGPREDGRKLNRFYVIMNTPIGEEQRLVEAGIRLPSLIDAGLIGDVPEQLDEDVLERLYHADAETKIFGRLSAIELRREPGLGWYLPGFLTVTTACVGLIVVTWLVTRVLFVWV